MIWMVLLEVFAVALLETLASDSTVENQPDEYPDLVRNYSDPLEHYHKSYDTHEVFSYLSNATLYKCQCHGNQIWNGSACIDHITYVTLFLAHGHMMTVQTNHFGYIIVKDIQCPTGQSKVLLDSSHYANDSFIILNSGNLYWFHQEFVNYCIDHTFNKNEKVNSWQASVCLSPRVPQCCPQEYVISPNGSCSYYGPYLFMPTVLADEMMMDYQATNVEVTNFTCEDGTEMYHRPLDSERVQVLYKPLGVELRWMPNSVQVINETQQYLCLGVEEADSGKSMQFVARLCSNDPYIIDKEICSNSACFRKCCKEYEFFNVDGCALAKNKSDLMTPAFVAQNDTTVKVSPPENLIIVYGFPLCETFFQLEPHRTKEDEFYLFDDGQLYVPSFQKNFSAKDYCLDNFLMDDDIVRTLPIVCIGSDKEESCEVIHAYVYPILMLVSSLFMSITLLVYVSVPELHANVHGKCLVSHMIALLTAYVSLMIVQWASSSLPMAACKFLASLIHVSFLAAFFWLNVMCFDIWWTLKSMRPVAGSGKPSRFRFKIYSLYSWGSPVLISLVATVIQLLPDTFEKVIRPYLNYDTCWLDSEFMTVSCFCCGDRLGDYPASSSMDTYYDASLWVYFHGFVLVLALANIWFFCHVAYILIMAHNDPIIQHTKQQNRERMWLYVKLFLVMGISWVTEVISWHGQPCEFWIVTDVINVLQGFSIFLIFICKRDILQKIRSQWEPYLRQMKEVVGSSRPPRSAATNRNGPKQSSFSSSLNRQNHSASQKTVQSQVSIDSLSVSRQLSASSLNSTVDVQVHCPHSFPMDTIQEANVPQSEPSVTGVIPQTSVSLDTICEVQTEQSSQITTEISYLDKAERTRRKSHSTGCSSPAEGGQNSIANNGRNETTEEEMQVPGVSTLSPDEKQTGDTLAKASPTRDSVSLKAHINPSVSTKSSDEVISYKTEVEGASIESTSKDISVLPNESIVTNNEVLPNPHINQAFSIAKDDEVFDLIA